LSHKGFSFFHKLCGPKRVQWERQGFTFVSAREYNGENRKPEGWRTAFHISTFFYQFPHIQQIPPTKNRGAARV
jgi:hypothetical protein